ncbi:MAG: transposase family protein [Actinobacteria bacterium]|nr:transposase family protein [Actinomycetota bacterium]
MDCPRCGVVREELPFCDLWATYAKRLAAEVALSCRKTRSLKAIAEQYGLDRKTVKEIDKRALERELPHPSDTPAKLLAADEFSDKTAKCASLSISILTVEGLFSMVSPAPPHRALLLALGFVPCPGLTPSR